MAQSTVSPIVIFCNQRFYIFFDQIEYVPNLYPEEYMLNYDLGLVVTNYQDDFFFTLYLN